MRRRRKQLILVTVVLVAFVAVLAVWVGNPNKGHESIVGPSTSPTAPVTAGGTLPDGTTSSSVATSPSPSTSGTGKASGVGGVTLPPVSGIQVYGAGIHQVVIHVTSDSVINAVGYAFRNGTNGKKMAVQKDFTYSTQVDGGAPLAIVGAQVSYYGTEVTCSISVDGHTRITKTVNGPYHVVVCIA